MSQLHHKEIPDSSQIYKSYETLYRRADKVNSNESKPIDRKSNKMIEEEEKQVRKLPDQKSSHFLEIQKENRVPNQFDSKTNLKLFQRRKVYRFNFKIMELDIDIETNIMHEHDQSILPQILLKRNEMYHPTLLNPLNMYVPQISKDGMVCGMISEEMLSKCIYYSNMYHTTLMAAKGKLPLPPRSIDEPPIYVNRKQYHRIKILREKRMKKEPLLIKNMKRKKYESRTKHAYRRPRNKNGRFFKKGEGPEQNPTDCQDSDKREDISKDSNST